MIREFVYALYMLYLVLYIYFTQYFVFASYMLYSVHRICPTQCSMNALLSVPYMLYPVLHM